VGIERAHGFGREFAIKVGIELGLPLFAGHGSSSVFRRESSAKNA
jgi:hypothetical protein